MNEQGAAVDATENPRRTRMVRLSHVEDFLINAAMQAKGTTAEATVLSALGSTLEEYHSETMAYIGELTLSTHEEKPATSEGAA